MSGHLFLARGRADHLACDAFLLVCGERPIPPEGALAGGRPFEVEGTVTVDEEGGRVLARPRDWPADRPEPWLLGAIGTDDAATSVPAVLAARVGRFLRAAAVAQGGRSLFHRSKPLLAVDLEALHEEPLGLLDALVAEAGFDPDERARLARLDVLEQAAILEERLEAEGRDLREEAAARGWIPCHSLTLAMLASLPVAEATLTTAYDSLYEQACAAAGDSVAPIPYGLPRPGQRWLLKLHGCVDHVEDIVLTRRDLHRSAEGDRLLEGMIRSFLLSKHVFFLGFSLRNDNFFRHTFFRTTDQMLRSARRRGADTRQAISLHLFGDTLLVSEVDCSSSRLLDPAFAPVLTGEEQELRDHLVRLRCEAPAAARSAPAWAEVEELLARLGDPGEGAGE